MTTYTVTGTTRDARGNPLGNVFVSLFSAATEALIASTTADNGGAFTFASLASNSPVFLVGYLSGSPDVAGTTLKTIVPDVESITLGVLSLDSANILENSAEDTFVGNILGVSGGSSLSLADSAGNRFKVTGTTIVAGPVSTDFESATSHNITIRESNGNANNSPRDTIVTITVGNLSEGGQHPMYYVFGLF